MSIEAIGDDYSLDYHLHTASKSKDEINEKVAQVYMYTAAAFAATCATAFLATTTGLAGRVLAVIAGSPLLTTLGMTAVAISLMVAIIRTPVENLGTKQGLFGLLSVCHGVFLSPLVLINAPAAALAAATTVGITGGLGVAAMKMKTQFDRYEKVLFVALAAIGLASLGALFLPTVAAGMAHTLAITAGIALFSAYIIYDTQEAKKAAALPRFDPINHSVNLYYDVLNLALDIFRLLAKE